MPVNGQQVFSCDYVHARLSERSFEFWIPVLAAVDPREPIPAVLDLVVRAQEPGLYALDFRHIAARDGKVAHGQLTQHLLKQIVQIVSRSNVREIRLVFLLSGCQIQAVIAGVIEEVTLDSPNFVINLPPLSPGVHTHFQPIGFQQSLVSLASTSTRRLGPWAAAHHRFGSLDEPPPALLVEHLLAVLRDLEKAHTAEGHVRLPLFQVETMNRQSELDSRARGWDLQRVKFACLCDLEPDVTPRWQRERENPLSEVVEVDLDDDLFLSLLFNSSLFLVGFLFLLLCLFLIGWFFLVALRG